MPATTTISGAASTSAHETVCQAPSSRASSPPSAYPIAAATTAPKSSRSDQCRPPNPLPCREAKTTAATAPQPASTQNAVGGRSCPRSTAITAVAAGRSAMTTALWLADAVVSANDVSTGKPTTTPPATTASRTHCRPWGNRCRVAERATAARAAATTARPQPTKTGCRPPSTAMRVNGTVKEKARTPSSPHQTPVLVIGSTSGRARVALSLCCMNDDSSARIVTALRSWIADAPPGARLPSTRTLVAEHGASPVTVQKALRTLAAQGVVESRPGVGTFVREARAVRAHDHGWQTAALGAAPERGPQLSTSLRTTPNDVVALHSGYPDRSLLPERLVRAATTRAARSDAAVGRPPSAGLPELQAWFAAELGSAAAGDVIVTPGSQSGLSIACRALVGAGRPLLVESPTYWGVIGAAAQARVELVPVPSGSHGPDPDELDRAFAATGARAFYAQPSFANPTGAHWSPDLADAVLDVVRARGVPRRGRLGPRLRHHRRRVAVGRARRQRARGLPAVAHQERLAGGAGGR